MMNPVGSADDTQKKKEQQQRQQLRERFLTSPEQTIEQIESSDDDTVWLVDFDETLWLRNSSETFLATIKPSLLVAIVVQLLAMLRPWVWLGKQDSEHYRETLRLRVIMKLFPKARQQWLAHAKKLGPQFVNKPLLEAILKRNPSKVHIVSFGFDFIVQPLLEAIDPRLKLTMYSTLESGIDIRKQGKAETVIQAIGEDAVANSGLVTDSLLDRDLLQRCKHGLLCIWPDAETIKGGLSPMLPFVFTKKVNRPKEKYFTRVILGHDYIGLLLAFALVSEQPILCAISLLLFVLAYFSIYETGYYENDRLGLIYEEKPRVSEEFKKLGHNFKPWFAWVCGLTIALPAALLASLGASWIPVALAVDGFAAFAAVWLAFVGFMIAVRAVFYWFNRTPVRGRVLPMLLLQFARNCGYILFFPTIEAGALFCLAWTLGKWFPYIIYRFNGSAMGYPNHLVTGLLMASMMLMVGFSSGEGFAIFANWQTLVLAGYIALRAAKDLWSFRGELKPMEPIAGRQL